MPDPKNLRAKYQLPALPQEVEEIAKLVKGRDQSSMGEIARVIQTNHMVSKRLITMAYPKPEARKEATVEMATSRLGLVRVIMMMVSDLLTEAVMDTFVKMFNMQLEPDDPSLPPLGSGCMVASVKFTGKANGEVQLGFSQHLSLLIAAHILDGNIDDDYPREVIIDAVGETVNIITGNLQSRLSDAGMPSEIGLPDVVCTTTMPKSTIENGSTEKFVFRAGMHMLSVHLTFAPFSHHR